MFGIWNINEASKITYFALHAMQHRGQEGAGIVSGDNVKLRGYRNTGLLSEVFKNPEKLDKLKGNNALGSVWYSNVDTNNVQNIEPLLFKFYDKEISICISGKLTNYRSLRKNLEEKGAVFHSSCDAELIVHLIRTSKEEKFVDQVKEALRQINGGFSLIIMTQKSIYGAVDKNCVRPLVLGKLGESYCISSETCAFNVIGAEFIRDITGAELITINDEGYKIEQYREREAVAVEAMEYIYFARPDSTILGKNVHQVRKNTGRILAQEKPVDADIVVGVPNSSLSLASGYAEEIGLPYEMGLIKNQYMGRTFIQPTQELRTMGVRMKLSAVSDIVKGKSVVLLDDSIVRGTTIRRIIGLLRDAGAKEIHVRIGSPLIVFPSFNGINMSNSQDLIGANKTIDEIIKEIECDSLEYISIEGLKRSIDFDFEDENKGLSLELFDGNYITGLGDNTNKFFNNLTKIQMEKLN